MVEKSFTTNTTKSKTVNNDIWFPRRTNISHVTYGIVYGSLKRNGSKNPNYFSTCFGILFYFILKFWFLNFLLDFRDFWCSVKFRQKEKYKMIKC
jgi:hypothetical protein